MARPLYCPCRNEAPDPCPECGATVSGNDKVRGICQALSGVRPEPLVELIVVWRDTGRPIDEARQSRLSTASFTEPREIA